MLGDVLGERRHAPAALAELRVEPDGERVRMRAVIAGLIAEATMQARRGGFEEMARLKPELGAIGFAVEDRLGRRRLDLREVADRVGAVDRRLRVRERGVRAPLAADAAGEIRFERILAPLDAEADGRLAVAIGILVERKTQPRDRCLFRMLARNDRIETPEPVEVGLQSAGACAIPPELRDGRARVVAREDAHQLAFALAFFVDANRDRRVVADVRKRNRRIGDGRNAVLAARPRRCGERGSCRREQRRDKKSTHAPAPPSPTATRRILPTFERRIVRLCDLGTCEFAYADARAGAGEVPGRS